MECVEEVAEAMRGGVRFDEVKNEDGSTTLVARVELGVATTVPDGVERGDVEAHLVGELERLARHPRRWGRK